MTCSGRHGDYWCPGWRARIRAIRQRDGHRCRDCGKKGKLHVHHLYYSAVHGRCGHCVLLGVGDAALITLCADCHDIRHGRKAAPVPVWRDVRESPPPRASYLIGRIVKKIRSLF